VSYLEKVYPVEYITPAFVCSGDEIAYYHREYGYLFTKMFTQVGSYNRIILIEYDDRIFGDHSKPWVPKFDGVFLEDV